jgi:galactokinase
MVGGMSLPRMLIGTNWLFGWSHTSSAADKQILQKNGNAKATAEILKAAAEVDLSPMETALLAQRAENRFVGVSCGLMDQAASACTLRSKLLLLDCGSRVYEQVDFPSDSITVVIAHSGVRRGLSASAYNQRRSECDEALKLINLGSGESYSNLCSVPREVFEAKAKSLSKILVRRARHVIGETERVHRAVEFLRTGHPEGAGELLNESHFSLRDDYEDSCPELDALTELCRGFAGVYGSRLTGAGFGGCTVTLVCPERAKELIEMLRWDYYEERGLEPLAFASLPAQGAEVVFRQD